MSVAEEDLDRFIADELEPEPTAVVEDDGVSQRYQVTDLSSADWAVRRIAAARRKHAEVTEAAAEQRRIIAAYERESADELASTEAFFGGLLRAYHEEILDGDAEAKTIKLPSGGRLTARAGRASIEVADPEAYLARAAEVAPETVRTRAEPDKRAMAEVLSVLDDGGLVHPETGATAPGARQVVGPTTFSVVTP